MSFKRFITTSLTVLCMSVFLCTSTLAFDLTDNRFADKTWEEVFADFLTEKNVKPEQVTAAYYNTVTGEEHIFNEGVLMYGASIAKLPTNMLYTERVSKGEMDFDTKIRGHIYGNILRESIVNSDNPAMDLMVRDLGGGSYAEFRKKILPYIGVAEEDATKDFLARNFFAPEHILYSLKLLYGNEERFPGLEAYMHYASPKEYFRGNEPAYAIAHKYGWYTDMGTTYINDSAIVYTDDPFLLVMFTSNVDEARQFLADFCSLMIDYTLYQRSLRYRTEALQQAEFGIPTQLSFITAEPSPTPSGYATWQFALLGAGAVCLLVGVILLLKKKWWTLLFLLLSVALVAVGCLPTALAYMAVENGEAAQTASDFSEEFADNYGIGYLNQYSDTMDDTEDAFVNKLIDSFRLTVENTHLSGNYITADVSYTTVDITAANEALTATWESSLTETLKDTHASKLFDAEGSFLPDIADSAFTAAADTVLNSWQDYLITENTTLHLTPVLEGLQPVWKIVANDAFLNMVNYES